MRLAEGWRVVALGDLADSVRETVKPEDIPRNSPLVLLEHIVSGTGELAVGSAVPGAVKSAKLKFEEGDVLFGRLRPNLRKVCVAPIGGICSTDIIVLRPRTNGTSYLLSTILRGPEVTTQVMRHVSGANLPRINVQDLKRISFPWPSDQRLEELECVCRGTSRVRAHIADLLDAANLVEEAVATART